jgi:DNA-binding NarL/FixJ family response regulator
MSNIAVNAVTNSRRDLAAETPVRVLICIGSGSARAELERLLEQQSRIRSKVPAEDIKHLRSAITDTDPDVVLLHLESNSEGLPWKELLALGVIVVLLVNKFDPGSLEAAVAEGVQAILVGYTTGPRLAAAVVGAASGLPTLSSDLAELVRRGLALAAHNREEPGDSTAEVTSLLDGFAEKLTRPELEVLAMISEGLSNKEIAAHLNISIHTAKFHISSILGKLEASSRAEAACIGLRNGSMA